ncbi:MAG: hypothetical protein H0W99_11880 [Acidobacteria bacterium]|nr:hypothetical protein [Acidobacteriota bacterium]
MLTQPDSVLLFIAVILFLLTGAVWRRTCVKAGYALLCCLAVTIALLPWTARNYFSLGMFQPPHFKECETRYDGLRYDTGRQSSSSVIKR